MTAPKEKEKQELIKKVHSDALKKSLFVEFGRLFREIAHVLKESPKAAELKAEHTAFAHPRISELLEKAEKIALDLQKFKEELFREYGTASYNFVSKSIDPMIDGAFRLIEEFRANTQKKGPDELFARAVASAQLYTQFGDEKKLLRRIIQEGISAMRLAIDRDIQLLRHYQHHSAQELDPERQLDLETLDAELEPCLAKFHALALEKVPTGNLKEFFLWKAHVDEKRSALAEEGFLIIDTYFGHPLGLGHEEELPGSGTPSEPPEADWAS